MSFLHYMYIGHFEQEGDYVRFTNTPTDSILKPVVRRPLDMETVKRLVRELKGSEIEPGNSLLPSDWAIWAEDGYLACDQCVLRPEEIDFIARLTQNTGCDLVDFNARSVVNSGDVFSLPATGFRSASVAAVPSQEAPGR